MMTVVIRRNKILLGNQFRGKVERTLIKEWCNVTIVINLYTILISVGRVIMLARKARKMMKHTWQKMMMNLIQFRCVDGNYKY